MSSDTTQRTPASVILDSDGGHMEINGSTSYLDAKDSHSRRSQAIERITLLSRLQRTSFSVTITENGSSDTIDVDPDGTVTEAATEQPPEVESDDLDLLGGLAESEPEKTKAATVRTPSRKTVATTLAGIVGLILLSGGSAYAIHANGTNEHDQALSSCIASQTSYKTAAQQLDKSHADSDNQAKTDAAQVADANTIHALNDARAAKRPSVAGICKPSMDTDELGKLETTFNDHTKTLHHQKSNLDMAVKAVVASRDAKSLAEAKGGLAQAVQDAQGTFDSSDGKVADTATRDRLREALDAANKVLADESVKDPKRYQDAQASLADPVNQVNESVNAKASADQAAAAAAAQAQAQAQAPAQSQPRQRSSSGSGSGSSSPRRSSGSTGSGSSNHGSTGSGTTPNTGSPSWSVPGAGSDSGNFSGTDPGL
jgi:hypothetical protein